ncbi:MAG: hypothetical protein Pg6C_12690 [Treponemataceae bacterium]|nr:MAG: hypothetical protein Pg6C_12690 [Treponemataceae bacterium]
MEIMGCDRGIKNLPFIMPTDSASDMENDIQKNNMRYSYYKFIILYYILFAAGFNTVPQSGQPFRAAQLLCPCRYVGSKPHSTTGLSVRNFLIEPTYPIALRRGMLVRKKKLLKLITNIKKLYYQIIMWNLYINCI